MPLQSRHSQSTIQALPHFFNLPSKAKSLSHKIKFYSLALSIVGMGSTTKLISKFTTDKVYFLLVQDVSCLFQPSVEILFCRELRWRHFPLVRFRLFRNSPCLVKSWPQNISQKFQTIHNPLLPINCVVWPSILCYCSLGYFPLHCWYSH